MDYIVYRKETCKIIEKEDGYYKLVPVNDTSIKYKVPVDSNFLKKECYSIILQVSFL